VSKLTDSWHSEHLDRTVEIARWGDVGRPVLVFPSAGGDFEEIERFHMIDACSELIADGRIKVYSCDSANGRAMLTHEGDSLHLSWILRRFVEFVGHELVPAIRADCQSDSIEIITAGASIGAYNALASLCRYPDLFSDAICMSGTYDLDRFMNGPTNDNFEWASPIHFVGSLEGDHLDRLRQRSVVLACGGGANEDIGESWSAAHVLGSAGVANRVDEWGAEWPHDWHTWRAMLPHYLAGLT
jgi:esterase/lipase superfamily enzyme